MKRKMMIVLAGIVSSVFASDIHVSLTGDGSDGLSWSTAFTNVQSAIDNATAGDAIRVQGGTYLLSQDIVWANKNNLSVRGSYEGSGTPGNSDPGLWPTVLKRQEGSICRILSVTNVGLFVHDCGSNRPTAMHEASKKFSFKTVNRKAS